MYNVAAFDMDALQHRIMLPPGAPGDRGGSVSQAFDHPLMLTTTLSCSEQMTERDTGGGIVDLGLVVLGAAGGGLVTWAWRMSVRRRRARDAILYGAGEYDHDGAEVLQ
jgi:hypothetical protein